MKKYNNTKTVIAVSNKSALLVYVVAALTISTAPYTLLLPLKITLTWHPVVVTIGTESKDSGDTIATVNEMIFFIVVGIAYIAAGI